MAFAEHLAVTMHDLDREELFEQPVRWADDPDAELIPLSADTFPLSALRRGRCGPPGGGRRPR